MKKLGINGFGRIGRNTLRAAIKYGIWDKIEIVAVNDPGMTPELAAYLFENDTVMGTFEGDVEAGNNGIKINGKSIKLLSEKDPASLPWKDIGVEIILECSGFFTDANKAKGHIDAGAKKVLISAPAKNEDITINLGVNPEMYDPVKHNIISMASCTTNCLSVVAKTLNDNFGIVKSLITTTHAYTSTQKILDAPDPRHVRRGRAAAANIVPTTTGASKATELVLPELKGKLDAMALRVPVVDASIIDMVALTEKPLTVELVNAAFKEAAEGKLKSIMSYTEKELVSSDYIGSPYSAIFDAKLTKVLGDNMVKLFAWYDNEMGYSTRLAECALFIARKL